MNYTKEEMENCFTAGVKFARDMMNNPSNSEYMMLIDAQRQVKNNIVLPDVSRQSELLFAFIAEVKKEFADRNWDYLDFIAERVLKANNSH